MTSPQLLLIEDDASLAELLEYRFAREGYRVRVTGDGDEALEMAEDDAPDLVILDWMIEGTSGIEVLRRLRRGQGTRHVPIIMLTAREAEDDRVRGLETGADDYLTKPFSPRELLARVAAVLRLCDFGQLDRPLAVAVGEVLHRADRVTGLLRKHVLTSALRKGEPQDRG
jgi:two-component system phosphate regulon response regulator PhoB